MKKTTRSFVWCASLIGLSAICLLCGCPPPAGSNSGSTAGGSRADSKPAAKSAAAPAPRSASASKPKPAAGSQAPAASKPADPSAFYAPAPEPASARGERPGMSKVDPLPQPMVRLSPSTDGAVPFSLERDGDKTATNPPPLPPPSNSKP